MPGGGKAGIQKHPPLPKGASNPGKAMAVVLTQAGGDEEPRVGRGGRGAPQTQPRESLAPRKIKIKCMPERVKAEFSLMNSMSDRV